MKPYYIAIIANEQMHIHSHYATKKEASDALALVCANLTDTTLDALRTNLASAISNYSLACYGRNLTFSRIYDAVRIVEVIDGIEHVTTVRIFEEGGSGDA